LTQIEALEPLPMRMDGILYKLRAGETMALPDTIAVKLMERAAGRVRVVHVEERVIVEPGPQRVAYWEGPDGCIRQGVVTWLGRVCQEYWVFIESTDRQSWVREDQLRSREQYESQHGTRTQAKGPYLTTIQR
jgi:hypothetical protein